MLQRLLNPFIAIISLIRDRDIRGSPKTVDPLYRGASHSAEIEYVLGNLPVNDVYDFQSEDYLVSSLAQTFFANFILTGDPNGAGVPDWNPVRAGKPAEVMILDTKSCLQTEQHRDRYLLFAKHSKQL